jgi:hypothetical protein
MQTSLLRSAAKMLTPGARLVIRSGLGDSSGRGRTSRITDVLAHLAGWMQEVPKCYPTRDSLERQLGDAGLRATFAPLYGNTPFNNWLIVAEPRGRGRPRAALARNNQDSATWTTHAMPSPDAGPPAMRKRRACTRRIPGPRPVADAHDVYTAAPSLAQRQRQRRAQSTDGNTGLGYVSRPSHAARMRRPT